MVGLVVPVEDLDCMGDSGWPCVFGNGGACLVVVVGVVGMLVVSLVLFVDNPVFSVKTIS